MSDDDLYDRLASAIHEDERTALAATRGPWRHDDWMHHHEPGTARFSEAVFAGASGAEAVCIATTGQADDAQSMKDAAHIARQNPKATLIRCDAERKLLDIAFRHAAKIDGEWGCCHSAEAIRAGQCPEQRPDELDIVVTLAVAHELIDPEED